MTKKKGVLICSECDDVKEMDDMVKVKLFGTGEKVLVCKSCIDELEREAEAQHQEDIDEYWNLVREGLS